jgi:type IV pilus assembly protein PilO
MNATIVKEILKSQPRMLGLIAALVLTNICLSAYVALYQKPRLAEIQVSWFNKRQSATGAAARGMVAAYRQGENDLQSWQSRVILKKDFARFVGSLFETARNNSLAFKGVTYKPSLVKGENLAAYSVDMNVVGKYAAVKSFIADLGRKPEIMTVDNLSLTSSVENGESVALKVQLTVYLRMEGQ